jgi:hypothetical protein
MRKLILIASSALAACNTAAPQMQTVQDTNSRPVQVKYVQFTDAQVKAALARAHIATPTNKLVNEASRYCLESGGKPGTKLYADCVNAKVIQLEDPTVKVVQVKPTQGFAQPTAQVPVQAPPQDANTALAKQFVDEASRYCHETGQKPGTQLFDDCVNANATQRTTLYLMTQIVANPAPAPAYAPAPTYQPPPRYPNTAAGNFAAGLTGGSVYDSPSSPPPRAPIICNTFGNTTTCQ